MAANSGIYFKRVDLPNSPMLKADALTVGVTENNTSIGSGVESIQTVEHILAVLFGLGIDNVLCELNGPEIPIMDGSGASFLYLLKQAGVCDLEEEKKILLIKKKVKVSSQDRWASIEPGLGFKVSSSIDFDHPVIGNQKFSFNFSSHAFVNEIVRARTFGLLKDVDALRDKGLVKGGSLKNAIVLDDFKVLNREGLRFKDEFIRHKVLDTIGDVSLLGHPIAGHIKSFKSGHFLNNKLCRSLLKDSEAFEIINSSDLEEFSREFFSLKSFVSSSH
jgi:UDP-3-O-[3-hydroxymyristoyl] N-acetylglucosamine deacetylase